MVPFFPAILGAPRALVAPSVLRRIPGLVCAAIATALPAAAADREPVLEELQVIGRREALAIAQRTSTAAAIAAEEQLSLSRSVGDWLELLPGVSLNGQGGLLQAYSVRGFSRARIRTEVDGIPILTDRRAGNSASFVPPDFLDEVVVERAASSSLYGSGAMGGVVSLNTVDAREMQVRMDARSNDEQLALAVLGGGEKLAGGISVRRADNAEAADGRGLNTSYEQVAGLLRGRQRRGALAVEYSWLPSIGWDIGRSNALFPERRISRTPDERHSLARVELRSDRDWLLRAYHHYQDWNTEVEQVGERRNLTTYEAHTLGGLFFAATQALGGEGAWGVEWVARRGVDIRESEFPVGADAIAGQQVVDGDEDTLGAFLEQTWSHAGTEIRGGVRVDRIEQSGAARDDGDTRWSGSVRLEHAASAALGLSAEVAAAYRFPSLSERYFNGVTPRGDVLGNPDLSPETRDSLELGLRYAPTRRPLTLAVAVYHSELNDYIERVRVDENLITFRNLTEADITGLEAQASLSWGAASHQLSYQWQEGEDGDGATLADLNPAEWRYLLTYPAGAYALRSDLRYRPSRTEQGPGEQPLASATIWNLGVARELTRQWRGELYMTNVLDETFRSSADDLAPLQPGRAVGIRLIWGRS